MQPQLALQGYGGEFLIQQPSPVMDQYYQQQQDISPGSAGIPSPTDSCSMYPMGIPMQLHSNVGYTSMQDIGMPPVFTPHPFGPAGGHSLRQRDFLRCRRKVDLTRMGYKSHPTAVARRNERERNRVKHINGTFSTLRQHLPSGAKNKKMSKVETLRSAIKYINHLQQILAAQDEEDAKSGTDAAESPHPTSTNDSDSIKRCIKTESDSGVELNNSDSSTSSSTETTNTDNSFNPDSSLTLPAMSQTSMTRDRGTSGSSSCSHSSTVPVSPSYSTKSIDSPIHSGYSSSDDPGYDTFAANEDELAELVDWLD